MRVGMRFSQVVEFWRMYRHIFGELKKFTFSATDCSSGGNSATSSYIVGANAADEDFLEEQAPMLFNK